MFTRYERIAILEKMMDVPIGQLGSITDVDWFKRRGVGSKTIGKLYSCGWCKCVELDGLPRRVVIYLSQVIEWPITRIKIINRIESGAITRDYPPDESGECYRSLLHWLAGVSNGWVKAAISEHLSETDAASIPSWQKTISTEEMMEMFGYRDKSAFFQEIKRQGVPYTRINSRKTIFFEEQVRAWLKAHTFGSAPDSP